VELVENLFIIPRSGYCKCMVRSKSRLSVQILQNRNCNIGIYEYMYTNTSLFHSTTIFLATAVFDQIKSYS
jgi:hypothetical protein